MIAGRSAMPHDMETSAGNEVRMTQSRKILIVVVIGTLSLLAFCSTHYLVTGGGGDLMWNSNADEAYLFWEVNSLGYRISYLEYPLQAFREYFGVGRDADDRQSSMAVWKITSTSLQSYTSDMLLSTVTPATDGLYANRDGTVWKWSVDHFEPLSPQEQQKFGGLSRLLGLRDANLQGWKVIRELGSQGKEVTYRMELGGKEIALVVDPGPQNKMSVDLVRTGQDALRIWTMSETHRRISKTEYEHLFKTQ
jgi:hypothetical protein